MSSASKGESDKAIEFTGELTKVGLSWYAWTGFYRWVVSTCVALLLIFGAFTGTVLLFEQNVKIQAQTEQFIKQNEMLDKQNAIISKQSLLFTRQTNEISKQNELRTISLVTELRNEFSDVRLSSISVAKYIAPAIYEKGAEECGVGPATVSDLDPLPNASTIEALVKTALTGTLRPLLVDALTSLLDDRKATVQLGALKVLDRLGEVPIRGKIEIRNSLIDSHYYIASNIELVFYDSFVNGLKCGDCEISLVDSIGINNSKKTNNWMPVSHVTNSLYFKNIENISSSNTVIFNSIMAGFDDTETKGLSNSNHLMNPSRVREGRTLYRTIDYDQIGPLENNAFYCDSLKDFSNSNEFVNYLS